MIYKFPQCDWSWPEWKGDGCSTLFSSFLQEKLESSSWLVTMNCWVTPGIMGVVCKFTAWMQKVAHLWSGKVVKSGFDFCSHAVADVIMFPSPGGKKNSVDVAFCFISPLWHLQPVFQWQIRILQAQTLVSVSIEATKAHTLNLERKCCQRQSGVDLYFSIPPSFLEGSPHYDPAAASEAAKYSKYNKPDTCLFQPSAGQLGRNWPYLLIRLLVSGRKWFFLVEIQKF